MTVVAVHSANPPGQAALQLAAEEALLRAEDLVVVSTESTAPTLGALRQLLGSTSDALETAGLNLSIEASPLSDPSDAVVQVAQLHEAQLIVIGLRRRTPVGKLILGSIAQRILLEATCPVLAVKP